MKLKKNKEKKIFHSGFLLCMVKSSKQKHGESTVSSLKKQPSRGVLRKRCSENMQQIYRREPMSKRDFNKVALQFY